MRYAVILLLALTQEVRADALADYWRAMAYRYAAEADFERSLTIPQRQMREAAEKAEAALKAAREKLAAECKGKLDENLLCKGDSTK